MLIHGGSPWTEPIKYGVDNCTVKINYSMSMFRVDSDVSFPTDMMREPNSQETRKRQQPEGKIPKLIDNKRRFLESNLSAAQWDRLLLEESKKEIQFRRDHIEAMKTSNHAFRRH